MTEPAKKARGKAGRSLQSKLLRRRLSASLALGWLAYTVAFVLVALLLNVTVVPRIADKIADSTSTWHEWRYDDYPLETCVDILGYELIDIVPSIEEASLEAKYLQEAQHSGDESAIDAANESAIPSVEAMGVAIDADGASSPDTYLVETASDGMQILRSVTSLVSAREQGDASEEEALGFAEEGIVVRFVDETGDYFNAFTLQDLQQFAINKVMDDSGMYEGGGWQVSAYDGVVYARDLSFYRFVKQFKIPAAAMLYLVGCIALIFVGYGRAMRYFDELSSAVGGLMADREKPVELPPALHLTEDELNSIRLSSLADERAAKSAERRKDELVAYLAHDIKTPLTSVMGYLMLLEEAPDMPAEQRQRYVGIAADKAQRLESLIDEFFEITRYNLQAIPIERGNVDMGLLLAQVADEFYPDAQARSLSIRVDAPEGETAFVDAGKFARAVGNVVRNAVAYADGGTEVRLSATPAEGEWRVVVRNDGREISEAHLSSIFEKFYREDASRGSGSGGAGLGLAIAKEIVVAHGGTIDAASESGTTTFTIAVPK